MGNKMKLVLNREGVRQMLRSAEMMDICGEYALRAEKRLGEGYEATLHTGKNRVNASVAAVSQRARKENHENQTILKAVTSK